MKYNKFTTPVKIEIPGIGTIESKDLLLKVEVDEAIEEFKADNERLKKCEIWMKQHFYCEEVIACESAKNRRLKRALWLARAEKAKTAKNMFDILWKFASREKVGVTGCAHKIKGAKTLKEPKFFFAKFQIAESKCRAKAEEFK
jgi:hypothetical protein